MLLASVAAAKNAAPHSSMHGTTPTTRNCQVQTVSILLRLGNTALDYRELPYPSLNLSLEQQYEEGIMPPCTDEKN